MMDNAQWMTESDHGLNKSALETAARAWVESKGDDPDRLMYGRRLYADGTRSLTCPLVPYWVLVAGDLIVAIRAFQKKEREDAHS